MLSKLKLSIGSRLAAFDARALLLLSIVSGMGGLVYEVIYLRQLTSVLGDMFYVHAALVSAFLLGNGIGAKYAQKFVKKLHWFEIAIGLYALCMPSILVSYQNSFVFHYVTNPVVSTMLSAFFLLALPSIFIGFSIPLFSEYVNQLGKIDDGFKVTYMLYNFGAAISLIVVEFWLIRQMGLSASLYIVACANIFCGLYLVLRKMPEQIILKSQEAADSISFRLIAAFFMASLSASLFQWIFIKTCYHLFTPHRENFAICTAIAVSSISLGTYLVRRFKLSFSNCLLLGAFFTGLVFAIYPSVIQDRFLYIKYAHPSITTEILAKVFAGFMLSIPYVFLGSTISALLQDEKNVVRSSGNLLFISGIANAIGVLLFTFVLFPNFNALVIPCVSIGLALLALFIYEQKLSIMKFATMGATVFLAGAFVYNYPEEMIFLNLTPEELGELSRVETYKSGSDNVSLVGHKNNGLTINYNGLPEIRVMLSGEPAIISETISGVIPAFMAPSLQDALVLGFGSGMTGGAASTVFKNVDIIEINSAFFPLSKKLSNFSVFDNKSAHIIHDDGRRFLNRIDNKKYDSIINSIPSPTYFSAGKIYTLEFLDMVKRALKPDGIYSTWFNVYDFSPRGSEILLATLSRKFKHCNMAILRDDYYYVTCSDTALKRRPLKDITIHPEVEKVIASTLNMTVEKYFAGIFLSDNIFENQNFTHIPSNTDDFPVLEFEIAKQKLTKSKIFSSSFVDKIFSSLGSENDDLFLNRAGLFFNMQSFHFQPYVERLRKDKALSDKLKKYVKE
jgi:predicted membrane-bound spermidine synthase